MKNTLIGLLLILGLTQCHSLIDLDPISEETRDTAYVKGTQLEAALVGLYSTFASSEYYIWDKMNMQDMRADNHYAGGDTPDLFAIDALNITPTNSRLFEIWKNLYDAISKANNLIEKAEQLDDPSFSEERLSQISGEAYFLRAYHYYNLVNMFGGVPLVTEFTTSVDNEKLQVKRATVEEVYAQIIKDLEVAISLLPDSFGNDNSVNKARATSGAANAMLAKAYLQMPSPNYQKALVYIKAVEESTANYQLIDYGHLFDGTHQNNAESILEIQFMGPNAGSFGPQLLLPPSISGDTWRKFLTPSHDLINAYNAENDNVRLNASVLFEAVDWSDEYWGNTSGTSIPFSYKWKNASGWQSSDNTYLLRFADIVLLKAEALAHTGSLVEAANEVDKIRRRVGLQGLTSDKKSDKESLLQAILDERRLELAAEGHRWDDLVRFGKVVSTMNNLVEIDLRTGEAVNYNMTENKILLPIPQQEIDRNPNLDQNPM
ncbi:RagB/SusD family nutrient uptake outer membrane protein [Flammeovirga agarivorans]|uniref:RagB/SusD family nutrient uptake outer membrane protein n=1 Tax=Flammeovirga agarivorans TaxID=2726742 RepID=A0A7X8SGQ6_9BACT|nr:RagB/SusD family nutrient uptake outer membrane protein [Flammeovirga agarivorans]NLR89936.1 RagB/SusD family nutrient uptake outer membrane protein [Flammeovirga agarivorans]